MKTKPFKLIFARDFGVNSLTLLKHTSVKILAFLNPAVLWALKTQLLQWNLEFIFLVLGNELWTWRTHNTSQGQFFI